MAEHSFTPDAVGTLGGPDWLAVRRVAAAERLAGSSLPSSAEEIWRYSRIDEFDPGRFVLATEPPAPGVPDAVGATASAMGERAGVVVTVNGRVTHVEIDETLAAKGVVLADLASLEEQPDSLGAAVSESPDWFTDLNDALLTGGVLISVPDGVVIDRPVLAFHWIDAESSGAGDAPIAVAPRVLVDAGHESEVTVLEHRSSPTDSDRELLSTGVSEVLVGDGARVQYVGVQFHGDVTWEVALQRAHVGRDARLTSSAVALGGSYARLRSESLVEGKGGSSDLLAVYFGDRDQMLDFRTLQDHSAPHSASDLLFKGAVEHRAHSVYSGLIRLQKGAQKADAHQTNRTLKLSPESHAESVPNLEILANDVSCTHASAIGPIDDDQRYYLESRGVPPEVAERLVVFGFFEDVFDRLPVGRLTGPLREAVQEKFERRDLTDD